jgi:GT2 family glycosyltransferase/glycosyltransferase involved in cell wall biosynthesis/peptidoglycan hydrolase CwlO-like protein
VAERDGQITSLNQAVAERDGQIANLNQTMVERDGQIANLNQVVVERDGQIAKLNQAVVERDGQIANLNQAVVERDGQINNLNQAVAERDGQITSLNQAVAERDGQIANLNQTMVERDGRIANLNLEVADYEGRIGAYHKEIMGRDESINALNHAVAERDRIIHETYRSHSWRLTKPIRFLSRIARRTINLGLKLKPSKIRFVYNLAKPHLQTVLRNPSRLKSKFHFFYLTWKSGGQKGIIQRLQQLQQAGSSISATHLPQLEKSVTELMRQLAFVPKAHDQVELQSNKKIVVIIPVYRGATETKRCIESVVHSTNLTSYEVIIINDCSPESEVDTLMNSYVDKYSHIKVLKNKKKLGYVQTVNHRMKLAEEADVILLNSDTEVANNWLDRLIHQAYADDRIGTVSPFSNNATICNYPDLDGWASLPDGETVSSLDKACSTANAGMSVDIPKAGEFCMYIKRSCLNDVGPFDEKAFVKGYGDANDFCVSATSKGWRHILAADIFVFHEGEISFSELANAKKAHAMTVIRNRNPNYNYVNTITSRNTQDSASPCRVSATAARYRLGERSVVLFITHTYGGGTEKHVQELADALSSNSVRVLFLRPYNGANGSDVMLESHNKCDKLSVGLSSQDIKLLAGVLNAFGVSKVHIHHTIGFGFPVEELVTQISAPYDVTIHDFYSICPRINLVIPKKGYCGSPTTDDCNACLAMEPKRGDGIEIIWWRAKFASLLNGANSVYCPSYDTARRIVEYYPAAPVEVVPHEDINLPLMRHATAVRKSRRIAILGVLAAHKGLILIEEALAVIEKNELPIEFALIGYPERPLPASKAITQTGPYDDSELPALIENIDPDAILFPAQCPETYSYTLSTAILSGRPVVVANIGSLPERVKVLSNAFVYPFTLSGSELVNYLLTLQLRPDEAEVKNGRIVAHG